MTGFYKIFVRSFAKRNKDTSPFSPDFKVYFNPMERIGIKTPLQTGNLTLRENGLEIAGDLSLQIPFKDITSLKLECPHSKAMPATLIEIRYPPDRILYLGVLRVAILKIFVINNLLKTIALFEKIKTKVPNSLVWSALD